MTFLQIMQTYATSDNMKWLGFRVRFSKSFWPRICILYLGRIGLMKKIRNLSDWDRCQAKFLTCYCSSVILLLRIRK